MSNNKTHYSNKIISLRSPEKGGMKAMTRRRRHPETRSNYAYVLWKYNSRNSPYKPEIGWSSQNESVKLFFDNYELML